MEETFAFVESTIFERLRPVYLDDDEYVGSQNVMVKNPLRGVVIPARVLKQMLEAFRDG